MGKALKAVGTAIMIVGAAVATGGMALAMGAGVGVLGSASLATSAVLSVGGFSMSAGALLSVGGLVSSVGGSLTQPRVSNAGGALGWVGDPNGPMHFAAGRIAVGGDLRHKAAYGPNDRMFFSAVTVVSDAGPIDAFEGFTANDVPVTFGADGKANSSFYGGKLWRRTQRGMQPEASYLASPSGLEGGATLPNWGPQHKLSAKAATILTMVENSKGSAYKGQQPRPREIIRGLLVYDWRRDSTYPGGAGPQRLNEPSTWAYSANPILWSVKWLLGLWEGPTGKGAPQVDYQVGGIGTQWENIDVPAFTEAANIADTHGWTCAAWPSTDDDKAQVLDAFLQAGGAYYIERAGKASCIHRAAPRVSVATITAADTAGPIELDTSASYLDRKNTGVATYLSEADGWKMTALSEVSSPHWVTEDGGRQRTVPVTYSYVDKVKQAAELMCLGLAHTREGISGRIPLKSYMQGIGPGSAFTITESEFVLDGLKCLCLETSYDANTGVHTVTFVSETDAKYPFAFGQTPNPPPPPALTPVDPTHVTAPLPGDWTIVPRPPGEGGVQVPIIDIIGEVSNATATAVHFEWWVVPFGVDPNVPPPADAAWQSAGIWPPTVTSIPVQADPGAVIWIAASYLRGGNFSERKPYGPITVPVLVSEDTVNVAGRPSSEILTDVDEVKAGLGAVVEEVSDVREVAVTNAAAGAMNANPTFAAADPEAPWPAVAPGWADWGWGWDRTVVAGQVSRYALRYVVPEGRNTGIQALYEAFRRTPKPGWYVLEAMVTLEAGSLDGAGLLLFHSAAPGTGALAISAIDFRTDADSSGNAVGGGVPGRTYAFSKIINVENAAVTSFDLFAMSGYVDGFGAISAKTIVWHQAMVREATAAEIETGQARGSYPTMSARLSSEFTAIAGEQGVMALRQDRLEARAGTNEFNNADFSQGLTGYRHMWGAADGRPISTDVINRSEFIYGVKTGGANYDGTDYVVFGSIELGGGSFALPGQNYERAFKVFEGDRIGFAFDSRPSGGTASFWVPVIRFYDNAGNFTGHWTAFGGNPYATDWERVGGVFDAPVDGYAAIEAYLRLKGTDVNATADAHLRCVTWARLPAGATQLPAYSAPAGGGQLAKVEETAGAVRTLEGKTKAWAERTVSAGSAEAFVQMKAEDDNGNPVSEINLGAQAIGLWTKIGDLFVPVFRLVGTSAHFAGKVFVGLMKQIVIDPDLPAIIWTKGNARLAIGLLPNDGLIYWFGPNVEPSAMRKANATEWRDDNGNARMSGTLLSGAISNNVQGSNTAVPASVTLGPFATSGGPITINWSYEFSRSGRRWGNQTGTVSGATSALIRLYRRIGSGAETLIDSMAVTGNMNAYYEPEQVPGQPSGTHGQTFFTEYMGDGRTYQDTVGGTQSRTYRIEVASRSMQSVAGDSPELDNMNQRYGIISGE